METEKEPNADSRTEKYTIFKKNCSNVLNSKYIVRNRVQEMVNEMKNMKVSFLVFQFI